MTGPAQQFPYILRDPSLGNASLAPMLPVTLSAIRNISITGLVDSGSAINVLPYSAGIQLGFDWDSETRIVNLSGNLASVEARVVKATASISNLSPVLLAFAWAKSDAIGVILGQVNFFLEFDVCFFRSRSVFEVRPRS